MAASLSETKQHAHELLDQLGPGQLAAVMHVMMMMLEPLTRKLANAPLEDEEISEEEKRAVADAQEWLNRNKAIAHEEVLAEFGLTMEDWERMGQTPLPGEPNGSGQ